MNKINNEIEKVNVDIDEFKTDIVISIETTFRKAKTDIIKWIAGMLVAQTIIIVTLIKLL